MKRQIYTFLMATALALPAAGAMATGMGGSTGSDTTGTFGAQGTLSDDSDIRTQNETLMRDNTVTDDMGTGADMDMDMDTDTDFSVGTEDRTGVTGDTGITGDTGMDMDRDARMGSRPDTGFGAGTSAQMGETGDPSANIQQLESKLSAQTDNVLDPQDLTSSEVRGVQAALEKGGHYQGSIDGLWGPRTAQALRAFQNENNLPETGTLNAQTLSRLSMTTGEPGSAQDWDRAQQPR